MCSTLYAERTTVLSYACLESSKDYYFHPDNLELLFFIQKRCDARATVALRLDCLIYIECEYLNSHLCNWYIVAVDVRLPIGGVVEVCKTLERYCTNI